jgi:2,4-dienoyl-CoA reductase-like NADH-dependent reductase (Old Yellow Enzyme family)
MSGLFDSYTLKGVTLHNRIVASPMCQYMALDGKVNDWHQVHYASLARGGVGLVVVEATAVVPEGRITLGDTGLWSDEQVTGLAAVAAAIKGAGAVAGIQLNHAGRKAGCTPPWEGGAPIPEGSPMAWQPVGPSQLPYMPEAPHIPREMSLADIRQTVQAFVDAARRALEAGFEWLELHFAHGFLAQTFLSTHTNRRTDMYGGSLENRARLLVEIVAAVRCVWPERLPLTARLGVVEFGADGVPDMDGSVQVLHWLKAAGLDFVDVGLALSTVTEQVPWGPNMLVPYADNIRRDSRLPTGTSWFITSATQADSLVREHKVDLVFMARTLLANPHWPYQAARELRIEAPASVLPTPYAYWLATWTA